MKVILVDGTQLSPIMVTGETTEIFGAKRDVLNFVFDDKYTLEYLEQFFTEENCETLILKQSSTTLEDGTVVDGSEDIHTSYTIRAGLEKTYEETNETDEDGKQIYVTRLMVKMAQRTYAENQLASIKKQMTEISDEVTNNQLALCELYESTIV